MTKNTTPWKINTKISANATALMIVLNDVTDYQVKSAFGKLPTGLKQKYSNQLVITHKDEKAIEETSCAEGTGIYTVYTCYQEWRIGGFITNEHMEDLASFIRSQPKEYPATVETEENKTVLTFSQTEALETKIYNTFMAMPELSMGEMGDAKDEATRIVRDWAEENNIEILNPEDWEG
jgi:hypothetical protein